MMEVLTGFVNMVRLEVGCQSGHRGSRINSDDRKVTGLGGPSGERKVLIRMMVMAILRKGAHPYLQGRGAWHSA
jgi:hypothetical protein